MSDRIYSHRDLIVYPKSFAAGKRIFELSKRFPREEMYSLTDQIRRSSRSVSANIAEAWRKRRHEKPSCGTFNIAEAEAAETQVWLEYAATHGYLDTQVAAQATEFYEQIIRMIVKIIYGSPNWCDLKEKEEEKSGRKRDGESGSEGVRENDGNDRVEDRYVVIDQQAALSPSPYLPDSPSNSEADDA